MGEVLAKSNIFVIIAALLQTFSFSTVPGEDKPKDEFVDGVTASPKPYRVLVNARMWIIGKFIKPKRYHRNDQMDKQ